VFEKSHLKGTQDRLAKLRAIVETNQEALDEAQEKLAAFQEEMAGVESELQAHKDELAAVKVALAEAQEHVNVMKKKAAVCRQQVDRSSNEINLQVSAPPPRPFCTLLDTRGPGICQR
jgi:chromosome segregation ATPase